MKRKLLVVEDDFDARGELYDFFTSWSFDVLAVTEGRSALREIKKTKFDLIILDLKLPNITGIDLLKRIRKTKRNQWVPVFVISGLNPNFYAEEVITNFATAFFEKPINLKDLETALVQEFSLRF